MASLTSSGIGSGLDINSLVTQLVQAERAPTSGRLTTRETRVQSKLSAYGGLKSAIAEFQEALKKLQKTETFQARTVKVGNETLLKATAGASATPGQYSIQVEALAQTQKLASAGFAASTTAVGTGRLDIQAGDVDFSVEIAPGSDSLAGIRDAINNASGNPGVRATLVQASTGTHLVITAAGSGEDKAVSISAVTDVDDTGNLGQLAYDPNAGSNPMEVKVAALDARIELDGFTLTSATNSFSAAIEGVTLNLTKAAPGEAFELQVGEDKTATRQAIDQFVSGYNKLQTKLNELTAYNPTTRSAGQLQGDAITQRLAGLMRNEINTALSGATLDLDTLAELGISSQAKGGTLTVSSTRLDGILATRGADIASLFSGSDGLAARMAKSLDAYSGSQGVIDSRSDSLRSEAKSLTSQRDALELRMSKLEARYMAQFTALDSLMSGLSNTSNFLTQQLANLS